MEAGAARAVAWTFGKAHNPLANARLAANLTSYLWRLMEVELPGGDEDENN
jgi:hypothetical protein